MEMSTGDRTFTREKEKRRSKYCMKIQFVTTVIQNHVTFKQKMHRTLRMEGVALCECET